MKTTILNITISTFILIFGANRLNAQMFAQRVEGDYVISYKLNQINQYISTQEPELKGKALQERLVKEGLYIKEDSILISFEIHHIDETETIRLMNRRGATFHQVLKGEKYYSGFVQMDSLLRFPYKFPNTTIRMELKFRIPLDCFEGPIRTNSVTYETGSGSPNAGVGMTIAIHDSDWNGYNFAMDNGKVPSVFTYYNCESGTCVAATIPGDINCPVGNFCAGHGTASVQTVFQHAPAANYLIYNTTTVEGAAAAFAHSADMGAHIISKSQFGFNAGWNDNSGIVCSAVNAPNTAGVLIFFGAGNSNNGGHWQNLDVLNFNIDGFAILGPGNENVNNKISPLDPSETYFTCIQCDNDGGGPTNIYEVQIISTETNQVLKHTQFSKSACLSYKNETLAQQLVGIRVKALTSFRPDFEMFDGNHGQMQWHTTSHQTTSPSNCTNNPRVLTVAAVAQANFHLNNANAEPYSSVGPTNNNNPSLSIAGPTYTTIFRYTEGGVQNTGTYGGTSAATPNVAGAAAAFWSKHPGLTADQVKDILLHKARNYKDWGDPGYDDTFGHGGAFLFSYDPNNIYLDQDSGESGVAPSNGVYPWYNIKDIHTHAPSGRNVIMLTDDNTTGPSVISKNMMINAAGNQYIYKTVK